MQYVKDKQLINFRQKAINSSDVQNCPWARQERLVGRKWPSGRTLPRSAVECLAVVHSTLDRSTEITLPEQSLEKILFGTIMPRILQPGWAQVKKDRAFWNTTRDLHIVAGCSISWPSDVLALNIALKISN